MLADRNKYQKSRYGEQFDSGTFDTNKYEVTQWSSCI